jgi:hypothetical protein
MSLGSDASLCQSSKAKGVTNVAQKFGSLTAMYVWSSITSAWQKTPVLRRPSDPAENKFTLVEDHVEILSSPPEQFS